MGKEDPDTEYHSTNPIIQAGLDKKDGNNMVFKFDGETPQERSFIHPALLKELGVDDEEPQIFIEKRDDWIDGFKDLRLQYKQIKHI